MLKITLLSLLILCLLILLALERVYRRFAQRQFLGGLFLCKQWKI